MCLAIAMLVTAAPVGALAADDADGAAVAGQEESIPIMLEPGDKVKSFSQWANRTAGAIISMVRLGMARRQISSCR